MMRPLPHPGSVPTAALTLTGAGAQTATRATRVVSALTSSRSARCECMLQLVRSDTSASAPADSESASLTVSIVSNATLRCAHGGKASLTAVPTGTCGAASTASVALAQLSNAAQALAGTVARRFT